MMNEQHPTMMNQYQQKPQQNFMNTMNQSLIHQQHSMNTMNQNSMHQHQQLMNQINPQMNRSYGDWAAPPPHYQNPNLYHPTAFNNSLAQRRINRKERRIISYKEQQRKLIKLGHQNRPKTRKFLHRKKFNKNNMSSRYPPLAPRNTSSFLIRAKKNGGIAPPTPIESPAREISVEFAERELELDDAYGSNSMNEFFPFSPFYQLEVANEEQKVEEEEQEVEVEEDVEEEDEDDEEDEGGSIVELENRMDNDLSRFETICDPNSIDQDSKDASNVVELEEENMSLKEKLLLMEIELRSLRKRMLILERSENRGDDHLVVFNDDVSENESDNNSIVDLDDEFIEGDNCQVLESTNSC
ncbi:hypothetical protein ABFS82_14G212400 [Erythranthe guttata]